MGGTIVNNVPFHVQDISGIDIKWIIILKIGVSRRKMA